MENNKISINKNFECTICLDTAKEPVLTKCGHMFCWPCIYNWLDSKEGKTKCPNCKNQITKNDLIPVYSSNENEENTNRFKNIPKRPKAERHIDNDNDNENDREDDQERLSFFSFNIGRLLSYFRVNLDFFNSNEDTSDIEENSQDNNYIQNSNNIGGNIQNNNISNNNQRTSNGFLSWISENTKKNIINFIKLFLVVLFLLQFTKFKIF